MITKWKLFNFKSIQEETELAFGPLTILAGSNSSGKSTILQSMLLISQTLASRVSSRSVVLNGSLVKLGQFDDLRSFGNIAQQILIGWECVPKQNHRQSVSFASRRRLLQRNLFETVSCELSFDVDSSSADHDIQQLQPRLFGCTLSSVIRRRDQESTARVSISRSQLDIPSKIRELKISENVMGSPTTEGLAYDVDFQLVDEEFREERFSVQPVGSLMEHFLPSRLVIHYDAMEEQANRLIATILAWPNRQIILRREQDWIVPDEMIKLLVYKLGKRVYPWLGNPKEPLFSQATLGELMDKFGTLSSHQQLVIRDTLAKRQKEFQTGLHGILTKERGENFRLTTRPLPSQLGETVTYIEQVFAGDMKYLGPLRDDPKPLYPLAANADPLDIGLRGENTAAVLDLHKRTFVRYIPTKSFAKATPTNEITTRTLERAVLDWLQHMGIAEQLETRDRGKLGHEVKITTPGTKNLHDLTHVGVGVSQVLPILVMCLLADQDTTLIIEQPELHLHPKVQTLLGDFFLSMALLEKQIIVETHSEYIINRLRFRAAADQGDHISNQLKIYFAEKKGDASHFREVNVNEYGAIMDWPEGFFDQSQSEAEEILRAATRKRKLAREEERNAKRNN